MSALRLLPLIPLSLSNSVISWLSCFFPIIFGQCNCGAIREDVDTVLG